MARQSRGCSLPLDFATPRNVTSFLQHHRRRRRQNELNHSCTLCIKWLSGAAPFRVYDCGRPGNDAERSQLITSATTEVAVIDEGAFYRDRSLARPSLSARPVDQAASTQTFPSALIHPIRHTWYISTMNNRPQKQSMAELKLRRVTEHIQRLRDDLARPRVRVSEAAQSLIRYTRTTKDPLVCFFHCLSYCSCSLVRVPE